MHASDRFLAPGTKLEQWLPKDGTVGYPDQLTHGETGRGRMTTTRSSAFSGRSNFTGWISVEDGMDGLDELRRSIEFLKRKRAEHYTREKGDGYPPSSCREKSRS